MGVPHNDRGGESAPPERHIFPSSPEWFDVPGLTPAQRLLGIEVTARSLIDAFPEAVRKYRSWCDGPRFEFGSVEAHNQRVFIAEASGQLRYLESRLRSLPGQVMTHLPALSKILRHVTTTAGFLEAEEKLAPVLDELRTIEVEAHGQRMKAVSDAGRKKDELTKLVDEGDRTKWMIWLQTKNVKPVFAAKKAVGKSPQAWTDFANGLRSEGLMENHPIRNAKEVRIHKSVLAKFEIEQPMWFEQP